MLARRKAYTGKLARREARMEGSSHRGTSSHGGKLAQGKLAHARTEGSSYALALGSSHTLAWREARTEGSSHTLTIESSHTLAWREARTGKLALGTSHTLARRDAHTGKLAYRDARTHRKSIVRKGKDSGELKIAPSPISPTVPCLDKVVQKGKDSAEVNRLLEEITTSMNPTVPCLNKVFTRERILKRFTGYKEGYSPSESHGTLLGQSVHKGKDSVENNRLFDEVTAL
ncbi:hypothetical protein BGX38DRAFT_1334052 [Terfezia claveryi]|nr:hypothetical protein BGX38DRAFT_1334052 [Terfezia claveryi]